MKTLSGLSNEFISLARAINDKGQVVGEASSGPFLWQDGKVTELGSLFGPPHENEIKDIPYGINDKTQVVGLSGGSELWHAFLWQDGHMTDLGTLARPGTITCYGGSFCVSAAAAINNAGQVVGTSDISTPAETLYEQQHAFLWQNGKMTDLNGLLPAASGWELTDANGINNRGQIIGGGTFNGQLSSFLMTPVHIVNATLQISLPSWRFAAHHRPDQRTRYHLDLQLRTSLGRFNIIQFAGDDPQDFAVTESTCGPTLASFTTCKVVFRFAPTAVGERTASLALNDNAQNGPHAIPVQGFGSSK